MNPQPIMPPASRPGWWTRNWKWFVPVTLLTLLVFAGLIIGLIVTAVMGSIKSSVPYTRAMAQAKADPALIAELGEPIEAGWLVTGSMRSSGSSSYANFDIPISGPKGSGTLHVVALKSPFSAETDDWKITVLEARINGRTEVIAVQGETTPQPALLTEDGSDAPGTVRPNAPIETVGPQPKGAGIAQGIPGGVPGGTTDETAPPAPPSVRPPTTVSGGVLNGKAIKLPTPPYPPAAKAVGASGTVVVQVTLDENGNVTSATAVTGHALLRAAAEQAARGARFTPTKLSGQAVKVTGVITYNFKQ